MMLLLLLLVSSVVGQLQFTWTVQSYYSGVGCTGDPIYVNTFRSNPGSCSPVGCQSGSGGSHSYQQTCGATCAATGSNCLGPLPSGTAELWDWSGSTQNCGANGAYLTSVRVSLTDLCLDIFSRGGSFRTVCNSGRTAVTNQVFNSRNCQGGSSPISSYNVGCSIPYGNSRSNQATCRVPTTTAPTLPPLSCSNLGSLTALTANELPSGSPGFFTTKTLTFCTAITGPVYLSSNSNSNGNLRVDDVLVYQLDSAPVVGLSYSGKCTASGFLSIPEGSIQQVGSRTSGPSVSLGTISAGQHTLKIGIFDCGGAAVNSIVNVVGCSVSSTCSAASTTTSPSGAGASSGTVWSGQYQVSSSCDSSCCCVSGTFSLIQSGTQVTGTLSLSGSCQGSTSAALSVTLSSTTATTVTGTVLSQQMQIVKNGNTVTLTNLDSPQCSGTATCTSGDCRSGGATSSAGGGNVCFHESTIIEYQGQKCTMQEIQKGKVLPECHIPHIVRSKNGVIIETSCSLPSSSLHLTGDHLVYTERDGLKAAHAVAIGDVLFANVQQTQPCRVTRVTKSEKEYTYFGLNCLNSELLANGIKTSTFGHYHAAPAAWMRIVGCVFGIERASRWGNSLAELWHSQH
jgi:hypothetical protein